MQSEFVSSEPRPREERPPIRVAVLLDGDADFFGEQFLSNGFDGGILAAYELRERVAKLFPSDRNVDVCAMVFWNAEGLQNYLHRTKPESYSSNFIASFSQGFSSSPRGALSVIDTGSTRQSADLALLRHLELFMPLFDVILLGGTHDGALYAKFLASLPPHELDNIRLLQTTPVMSPAVSNLGLRRHTFQGIFDGRHPNNGLRHTMYDHEEKRLKREETYSILKEQTGGMLDCARPLLYHVIKLSRKSASKARWIRFNDLAGALGGDSLLDFSPEGLIMSEVAAEMQRELVGIPEFIDWIGRSSGLLEFEGRSENKLVRLADRHRDAIHLCV